MSCHSVLSFPWLSSCCPYISEPYPSILPSHLSLLHWLCIFFLLNLRSRSLLRHAIFWPAQQDFLHIMMVSSCAIRKVALKCCQFWAAHMSLRTVSQGISFTNSLNTLTFYFLMFRVLTILLARPTLHEITDSTRVWSVQPRVCRDFALLMSSPTSEHQAQSCFSLVSLANTGTRNLSSTHSWSVLDCLQLAVLLSQQMSRWWNPSIRMRGGEDDVSAAKARRPHQQAPPDQRPVCNLNHPVSFLVPPVQLPLLLLLLTTVTAHLGRFLCH